MVKFMLLLMLVGCASKPQLYPNDKLKRVGGKVAQEDVDACMSDADAYLKSSKGKKVVKSAGAGAAIGATFGVISGLFTGNVGGGVVRGGAIGAGVGATSGAISPDDLKRHYVNRCLADKGYEVIGWD